MDASMDIAGSAMTALQNQKLPTPGMAAIGQGKSDAAITRTASEFEGVFVSQFLSSMFSGIPTDGIGGGGQGEEMFRSMMVDQYAKGITQQGGFGLAASIKAQMLKMQEATP